MNMNSNYFFFFLLFHTPKIIILMQGFPFSTTNKQYTYIPNSYIFVSFTCYNQELTLAFYLFYVGIMMKLPLVSVYSRWRLPGRLLR